jgi:hypothetical protein
MSDSDKDDPEVILELISIENDRIATEDGTAEDNTVENNAEENNTEEMISHEPVGIPNQDTEFNQKAFENEDSKDDTRITTPTKSASPTSIYNAKKPKKSPRLPSLLQKIRKLKKMRDKGAFIFRQYSDIRVKDSLFENVDKTKLGLITSNECYINVISTKITESSKKKDEIDKEIKELKKKIEDLQKSRRECASELDQENLKRIRLIRDQVVLLREARSSNK